MNNYTVDWTKDALRELASIWMATGRSAAVTRAQYEIDRRLAANPLGVGTDVAEGLRRLTVPPLTVYYSVDDARRFVETLLSGQGHGRNVGEFDCLRQPARTRRPSRPRTNRRYSAA